MFNVTLCLGFAYFRSCASMVSLWSQVFDKMLLKTYPDDQWSMNYEIFVYGNFSMDKKFLPMDSFQGSFDSPVVGTPIRIVLLPAEHVQRNCDSNTSVRATVAHCYSSEPAKSTKAKIASVKGLHLWRVRKDWQKIFLGYNNTSLLKNHTNLLALLIAPPSLTISLL